MTFNIDDNIEGDQSAYTAGDLVGALVQWELDADYISSIAEDLPEDALDQACIGLYGEAGGDRMAALVEQVIDVSPDRGRSAPPIVEVVGGHLF